MKILTKYIVKEHLRVFLLTALSLLSLFLIIGLFEVLKDVFQYNAPIGIAGRYLLFKIPQAIYFMFPIIVLISTIVTIGVFSKSNELIVMRACGIGLVQFALPMFIVAIIAAGVVFLNGEYLLPQSNREMERIMKVEIKKKELKGKQLNNGIWYHSDNGSIWEIKLLNNGGKSLRGIKIYQFNEENMIVSLIESRMAEWSETGWVFRDLWIRNFTSDGSFKAEYIKKKMIPLPEKPSDFITIQKDPDKMSYREMRHYVAKLKREGLDSTRYRVDMESKLSFPFISLVMVLIGIPFALRSGREGGITIAIGMGVVIGMSVWFVYSMGLSLGRGGKLPPLLAAWGSNILFTLLAAYLWKSSET
ncbi:MAG: LPS export ABC transporter permease LptG [Nitrospinota bacterium]